MQNRTEKHDNPKQNHDQRDVIRVARPDWMPDDVWAEITRLATAKLDELVEAAHRGDAQARAVYESPQGGCSELAWCVMGPTGEHLDYHAGAVTHLFGVDEPGEPGWWVSPSQDRDGEPQLNFEGRFSWSTRAESFELPADQGMAVLAATRDRASRKALEALVKAALVSGS